MVTFPKDEGAQLLSPHCVEMHVSACRQLFRQFSIELDTAKMSRFALIVLVLSLVKREVNCTTLGNVRNLKFNESFMPSTNGVLPNDSAELYSVFPTTNKVLVNGSITTGQADGNLTSQRNPKFISKIGFLAGLNIGGGSSSSASSKLTSLAKISEAPIPTGFISPYLAVTYEPYAHSPTTYDKQKSIGKIYELLDLIKVQLDQQMAVNNSRSDSISVTDNKTIEINESEDNNVDDRRRQNDKLKVSKPSTHKRKESLSEAQKISTDLDYQEDPGNSDMTTDTTTMKPSNTSVNNGTYPYHPGYYGGYPLAIDHVGFSHHEPHDAYGPPSFSDGPPSHTYDAPSYPYVPSSHAYGSAPHSYHEQESIIYDDSTANFFAPPEQFQQLPFARSRNYRSSARFSSGASKNGFVPV